MSAIFQGAIDAMANADFDVLVDNIKAVLVDLDDVTAVTSITNATNATPIVVTSASHGRSTGDVVNIVGVAGNTAANGVFQVTVSDANTFSLQTLAGANVAGNGAYTSGGKVIPLGSTSLDNLDDIPSGARVATSANLGSKAFSAGIFDAADTSFSTVSGDVCEAVVLYKDTGVASTSTLFMVLDQNGGTGLPVTPNGGNINLAFSNGTEKIFRIRPG